MALLRLPDLAAWADQTQQLLRPGGRLYLPEFHPLIDAMDEDEIRFEFDYFRGRPGFMWNGPGNYATAAPTQHDENWEWIHGLATSSPRSPATVSGSRS